MSAPPGTNRKSPAPRPRTGSQQFRCRQLPGTPTPSTPPSPTPQGLCTSWGTYLGYSQIQASRLLCSSPGAESGFAVDIHVFALLNRPSERLSESRPLLESDSVSR